MSPPTHLANLRDVRVRAQSILRRIDRLDAGLRLQSASARLQEVNSAFAEESQPHHDDVWTIGERLAAARDSMEKRADSLEDSGDLLSEIELAWAGARLAWPHWPESGLEADQLNDVKNRLRRAKRHLRRLIFLIGKATIPYRLERWLEDIRVGGQLDFAAEFGEELPRARDRQKILEYLAAAPAPSLGLIDAKAGRVFRISDNRRRQFLSYAGIALVAALGALLIWVLAVLGPTWNVRDWPFTDLGELWTAYGFVIAGAVLHFVVDALKQERHGGGAGGLLALDDLWLWGHVREKSIWISMVALVVVTLGLAAVPGVEANFLTALFAGYSADSIIDLFLNRFETFSTAQVARLEEALAETETESGADDDD